MTSFSRDSLMRALPYARRYARALTGNQKRGDGLVADALKQLLASGSSEGVDVRMAIYRDITQRSGFEQAPADVYLNGTERQLLLLTSLEEVSMEEAALIVGLATTKACEMLVSARKRLREAAATDVLIIEDEPIIAMDIEELVANCGHRVVGVAATEAEAVTLAEQTRPGLILADINLGNGGDGSSAVARIMRNHYAPVIFVTAYPERLLTGDALEPAFVITKPFEPLTLAIATYQAVTGGVHIN